MSNKTQNQSIKALILDRVFGDGVFDSGICLVFEL